MIVTLEWLLRLQKDLPRPTRAGVVFRVYNPNQAPYFIVEPPVEFREVETFELKAAVIEDEHGDRTLRWMFPKDLKVAL